MFLWPWVQFHGWDQIVFFNFSIFQGQKNIVNIKKYKFPLKQINVKMIFSSNITLSSFKILEFFWKKNTKIFINRKVNSKSTLIPIQ